MTTAVRVSHGAPRFTTERVRVPNLTDLDSLLFESNCGYADQLVISEQRRGWIVDAVENHLGRSKAFANLAGYENFLIDDLRESGDLATVPLLSSGSFKRGSVSSAVDGPTKRCLSSGTRGSQSVVPRDDRTLERFTGTVLRGIRDQLGDNEARHIYVLAPPPAEAGDLWFSYVLSLAQLYSDTTFHVQGGVFDPASLVAQISSSPGEVQPVIVAPPNLLLDLVVWLEEERRRLDIGTVEGWVVTAGGWKRREGERVDRSSLETRLRERLQVPGHQIRDVFNMVELNTVVFECEYQRKHVPPWLEVIVRRPSDFSVADSEEVGILTYLDPTAISFPCFVLSDDLGSLSNAPCSCGSPGPTMSLARRLTSIEERGCALKMDRYRGAEE